MKTEYAQFSTHKIKMKKGFNLYLETQYYWHCPNSKSK